MCGEVSAGPGVLRAEAVFAVALAVELGLLASPSDAFELAAPTLDAKGFAVYALQNPLVTFAVAAALYFVIPRLFRAAVRFLVLPAGLAAVAYATWTNPRAVTSTASFIFSCTALQSPPLDARLFCRSYPRKELVS